MTVARTWGVALSGAEGALVEIEADLSQQLPEFRLIGLADKALGEAQLRVRNATENCGMPLPRRRLTVNLSPASLPKHGAGFDVGIAVASLATGGALDLDSIARTAHIGELGLDGRVRPVPGVLPAVLAARSAGVRDVVVPAANQQEAELVDGVRVHGVVSLLDVVRLHGAAVEDRVFEPVEAPPAGADRSVVPELADVLGQGDAVDALVVAAAGGHHLLMSGPPGSGKTMLAERLPGILPELDDEQSLRLAAVRSLSGERITRLDRVPPFEAPHHSASMTALVGGGTRIVRPGAIARATHGVLFLDEAAEYGAHALDALRQPLESGSITIHRSGVTATFPARFQLVALCVRLDSVHSISCVRERGSWASSEIRPDA